MPELILVEQVKAYLIAQNVVRDPTTAGPLPPVWLNPHEGAKQPAGADTSAVSLVRTGGIPTDYFEGFIEEQIIDVWVRSKSSPAGELLQRSIKNLLHDKRHVTMGSLLVQHSMQWRATQPVPLLGDGQTVKTWDTVQGFRIAARTAALAGN